MPPVQPLCFVLMPFRSRKDPSRPRKPEIAFDAIYRQAIEPAIHDAGLSPIRADHEETLGVIHKPMFERLLLCDFAVADLTLPNPNVFYELGVRHASRLNTTLPIFADHVKMPFDVALLRALPYTIGADNSFGPTETAALRRGLGDRLRTLRELARTTAAVDSPVFQLVDRSRQGSLPRDAALRRIRDTDGALYELLDRYGAHDKTDIFREMVAYADARGRALASARGLPKAAAIQELDRLQADMQPLEDTEAGAIVDLYLSFRAFSAWDRMVALYDAMPEILRRTVLVREQLAFALNRLATRDPARHDRALQDRAIHTLEQVQAEVGHNPETNGLLGRIHKDRWQAALSQGDPHGALGHLRRAIDTYTSGFASDCRDAYPGVNAVTLLDIEGSEASVARKLELLPVVRFAVSRRIATGKPDYWDYATLLELAVLAGRQEDAAGLLADARAHHREPWELGTTAKNLGYIRDARRARQEDTRWLDGIVTALGEGGA